MVNREEKRNYAYGRTNTVKKIGILITVSLMLIVSVIPVFASTVTSVLNEPIPSLHTAYLYVGSNTTGKLFMISSPADLKDLFLQASYDGSKWQLATGSLKDGLAADIIVTRYNAVTGAYENRYVIDTGSYKTTSIVTASTYTQYVSFGIPVLETGTTTLASVDWQGEDDVELTLIKSLVNGIKTDTTNANNYLSEIETIVNTISSTATTISSRVNTTNTRLNTIISYLQSEIPVIENTLSNIYDDTGTIINKLKECINELQTANYWLEQIYNVINDNNATTIPNENASNIEEYNSMEEELMQDKSGEIESLFNDNAGINPNGISFINGLIQQWAFSIPEISSIIIMFLAIGLGVLLLGRKV